MTCPDGNDPELGKDLRRLGLSYGEIMGLITVKKSTLATWCRDVGLTEIQYAAIKSRTGSVAGIPRDTNHKRRREIEELREIAQDLVPDLIKDPFWVAGLVLYWAEGAKTRGHVSMANTDPRALRLFIRWVRTYIDPKAKFSLQLHLHEGNNEPLAQRYWLTETGLFDSNFHKTFIKPKGTGHRKNHLKHGVCTVKVRRGRRPLEHRYGVDRRCFATFRPRFQDPLEFRARAAGATGSAGRS